VLYSTLAAVLIQTLTGGSVDALRAPAGTTAIVYIFTSTECPISNRYAPEVRRLVDTFASKGVRFRLVYPDPADTREAIREHVAAFAYGDRTEAFRDPDHALVTLAHATVTPEAAVFANGRLMYHGRIDDRVVDLGLERPAPTVHDLGDALTAILAGAPVPHAETHAVGCYIADFKR
jgi:hypothetical protein